jgi:hypothetical protein
MNTDTIRTDTLTVDTLSAAALSPACGGPVAAQTMFGKYSISVMPPATAAREGSLRESIFKFNAHFGLVWALLCLFLVVLFLRRQKKVNVIISNLFYYRKFVNIQRFQSAQLLTTYGLFCILILAACIAEIGQVFQGISLDDGGFMINFAIAFVGCALFFALKSGICYVILSIAKQKALFINMFYTQIFTFVAMCFTLIALCCVYTLVLPVNAISLLYIQGAVALLFLLIYFVRSFFIFVEKEVPFFFWLLYFCTVEILPIALVCKQF